MDPLKEQAIFIEDNERNTKVPIPAGKVTFANDKFELTVSRSVKISTAQYENTDIAISIKREFTTGSDGPGMLDAYHLLSGDVRQMVKLEIDRVLNAKRNEDPRVKKFGL